MDSGYILSQYQSWKETVHANVLEEAGEEFQFIERCNACHMSYEGSPWPNSSKPYTPFTPEVDPKYTFDFDKAVRNHDAMHQHYKLVGVFTGPPLPPFHQEFQKAAQPASEE